MVLGGSSMAKKRSGGKGAKLSKAERDQRKAARVEAAQASFALSLPASVVASLHELTAAGRIVEAEKAAHASAAPGLAVAEILRTMAADAGPAFRAATAAHVARRFAARCPEAAAVLATVILPEVLASHHYECAAVSIDHDPTWLVCLTHGLYEGGGRIAGGHEDFPSAPHRDPGM
jgi:hypothetical protein